MRPIDADALKNMRFSCGMHDDNYIVYAPIREVMENIDKAPTIEFDKDNTVRRKPTPDDPLMSVLICAVRYCLGRRTYMPELVTSWIMAAVPELPAETALIMLRDINDQRRMGERIGKEALGDPCDVKTWEKFEAWLQGRISQ